MQTSLPITTDIDGYTELTLEPGTLDIGRAAENHITIDDPAIKPYHARIVTYFHESFLIDLCGEGGIYLNGERVIKHSIRHGDVIQLGNHRFVIKMPREWFY